MTELELMVASVPDRDEVVVEIWLKDKHIAEVRRVDEHSLAEFYPDSSALPWSVSVDALLSALEEAKKRLGWSRR